MENNNKSQAELYREERKERLAKAAAKNAKRSPKSIKASQTVKKVISIVLAVVVALGAVVGVLTFFDVPQKAVKISIDGIKSKISLAEINYFYFQTWSQSYSNAVQYAQYGIDIGFDYTKTPESQAYTEDHVSYAGVTMEELGDIENPTWQDVFTYSAVTQLVYIKYGAEKAKELDMEITEEERTEIDSQFEEIRATAKENDYSLNRWLRLQLGYGVTEKMIENIMVDSYLAEAYYEKVTEEAKAAVTEDVINAEYAENRDNYDIVDLRIYAFAAEMGEHTHEDTEEHEQQHEEASAEAKAKAEAFVKKVTDEESFIAAAKAEILSADNESTKDPDGTTLVEGKLYSELTSSYSEEVSKWAFDDARKDGDVAVVDDGNGSFYAVMMKSLPKKDTSIYSSDVRHILVKFPDENTDGTATSTTDEDGNTVTNITDATKAETKAKAQAILDEYLKNPTEENFIALVKEKTDDNSKETGGLYEGVMNDGTYVEAFTNWAIEDGRQVGDTGIVETEYGYHIMYFVKSNGENWSTAIITAISGAEIEENVANVIDAAAKNINIDSFFINWTLKRENDHIANILVNNL